MGKYNTKVEPIVTKTVTHQGGTGFTQTSVNELVGLLATGLSNTYYENEGQREKRFREVISDVAKKNPAFAAKALIYARTVFGQRTVTHYGAVEMIPFLQGNPLAKKFFSKRNRNKNEGGIVYRIDDMNEILACYLAKNGQDASIPNSIKKGFKDAIENSDKYVLAKYQAKGKTVSLVDIVNLVHPVQTKTQGTVTVPVVDYIKAVKGTKWETKTSDYKVGNPEKGVEIPTLHALVLGLLKQFDTVEDKNTETGKVVAEKVKSGEITKEQAAVELNEAKTDNYKELIETKKIGYLALLRNLRNILKTGDTTLLDSACELLVQPDFIRKSLVWPHMIDLALEILLIEFPPKLMTKVATALGLAYELSIPNLKELLPEGDTAIVFDTSGSMSTAGDVRIDAKTCINKSPAEKAALIAATLAKGVGGEVYHFANQAEQIKGWNPVDSINTLKQKFMSYSGRQGHGTNFGSCFHLFDKKYDRVLIISDEQDGGGNVENNYKNYCAKFGTPYVYIININGYGPVAMKENSRVFRIFGYTGAIYETIKSKEIDVNAVIKAINEIVI